MRFTHQQNKSGVSEIIATILTLAITVVLFSSLFVWIGQLEGPDEQTYADFEAEIFEGGVNTSLRITHYGGEPLLTYSTEIFVYVEGIATIYDLPHGGVNTEYWDVGSTWLGDIGPISNQTLEIAIINAQLEQTVWVGRIGGISSAVAPLIFQGTTDPRVIAQGESFNLSARVYDSDYNLASVTVDLTNLGYVGERDLTEIGSTGVWTRTDTVPDTAPVGTHTITFKAYDSDTPQNTDTRTITVIILPASARAPKIEFPSAIPSTVWELYRFNVTAKITDAVNSYGITIPTTTIQVNRNTSSFPVLNRQMIDTEVGGVFRTITPLIAPVIGASNVYNFTIFADNGIANATNTTSITVVSSDVPIISWAIAEPNSFTQGDSIKITAKVLDQENDVTSVTADLSSVNLTNNLVLNRVGFSDVYQAWIHDTTAAFTGDDNITVDAIDALGHSAITEEVFLRILDPNPGVAEQPPIITSIVVTPNPVRTNGNFSVQAIVIDLNGNLDTSDIKVNLSSMGFNDIFLTDTGDGRTFLATNITPSAIPGNYQIRVWANDTSPSSPATYSPAILEVIPEQGVLTGPDIAFQDLTFSNDAPVHAPETIVTITAWVVNLGGTSGQEAVNATIRFEDEGAEGTTIIADVQKDIYNAPLPVFAEWHPTTGGNHKITARMLSSNPIEDPGASAVNNVTSRNITVRPSILLVDDDHAPQDGSPWDATSWMRSALRASSFIDSTTFHTVSSTDGPRWSGGDHPLQDYDIVIWMTGYETNDTLTANDRAELETFLSHNRSLWLISEGAMDDPGVLGWTWANGTSVLHVNPGGVVTSNAPIDPFIGDINHTITSGKIYNLTDRGPYSQGDYLDTDGIGDPMLYDNTGGLTAISYNDSYKSILFSSEFSKMFYPADQATLTFNVLLWLSGLTEWSGEDIAVAQVSANPDSPNYNDNFTINAKIRNNGASAWTVTSGFYLDGARITLTDPRVNAALSQDTIFLNPGEEGDVYIEMVADIAPGSHTLSVIADPENDISETNELNNEISSDDPIFDLNLYVKFTLLVVDDDDSANNGGLLPEVTTNMTDALDQLGYPYTVYVVPSGADGPDSATIARYKGTIWMCGEADTDTLTVTDQSILRDYIFNESGQMWIVGQDILWELTVQTDTTFTPGSFAYDVLHVESVEHNTQTPDPIIGVNYNEITHGMSYQTDSTLVFPSTGDLGDRIVPTTDAEGIFWQDSSQTSYNAVQWDSNVTGAKVVFMPWEYAFLSGLFQRPLDITTRSDGTRAPTVYLQNSFDVDSDGWTYIDGDIFQGEFGIAGDAGDSWGTWTNTQGHDANGALEAEAGSAGCNNAQPGWQETFNVPSAGNVYISFWYNHWMGESYEGNEYSTVHVSVDGTLYTPYESGSLGNNRWQYISYLNQDNPGFDPQTGWEKYWFIANLGVGNHDIEIGLYNNAATAGSEISYLWIDDIYIADASQWTSFYEDDFEADDDFATWDAEVQGNRWQIRNDGGGQLDYNGDTVSYVPEGQRAADSRGGGNYYIQKDLGDLSSYIDIEISFFFQCQDFETTDGEPSLDLWYDGSWRTDQYMVTPNWDGSEGRIPDNDGDQTSNNQDDWYYGVFELNDANPAITDWTDVRMRFYRTGGGIGDELFLDEVQVTGFLGAVTPTALGISFPIYAPEDTITRLDATIRSQGEQADDAEYWYGLITDDPGQGLATNINPADGVWDEVDETVRDSNLDVSALADGAHTYWVRGHSASGWGVPSSGTINIASDMPATTNALAVPNPATEITTISISAQIDDQYSNLQAAEWWWETLGDQGAGNNNPMTAQDGLFDSNSEIVLDATADITGVPLGVQRLFIRGQDVGGRWNTTIADGTGFVGTFIDVTINTNLPITSNVVVSPDPTDGAGTVFVTALVTDGESVITQAEAYIDTDPGEGSGSPLTVPGNGPAPVSITVSGNVDVSSLSLGSHTMYVRARQQSDNRWGLNSSITFQVTEPDATGPVVLVAAADPNPTEGSDLIDIAGTVRDLRSTMAGAEYFIGSIGAEGTGTTMNVTDGSWDGLLENVEATLNITGWAFGEYDIYVRGKDSEDNWGPSYTFTLSVTRPPVEEKLAVQSELTFMVMKFFDHPETRPELRVVTVDLNITTQSLSSDVNPMLGETYLVSAEVYNPGGTDRTAVVKLLDGQNIIATQSLFVESHGKSTLEAVWSPQLVGQRNIIAQISPDPDEVFTFNNQAYRSLETYFFHDNMESGTDKWSHDDTILLINGESKLDFMNPPVNSTIISTWSSTDFNATTNHSHSHEYSYGVDELMGGGVRPPIDVVFALDTSGSMSSTDMDNMRQATNNFIARLEAQDRAAVWIFDGGGSTSTADPELLESYAYMTNANKVQFYNSVNGTVDSGFTPFYDTVGAAINYTQDYLLPNRLEFVVGMTDGASNADDIYTPNANWGQVVAPDSEYSSTAPHPTNGLLNPPCMVYTIGLGITHDPAYPTAPGWSRTAPAGALEYDAWHVADASPSPLHDAGGKYGENATTGVDNVGHYYYTTDSAQLPGIFDDIFQQIQTLSEQAATRSGVEAATRAIVERTAITDTFSLVNVSEATVSFYHKYKLELGANGGVVMVGTSPDSGLSWVYQYVIPKQSYPGNLKFDQTEYDDTGRVVRWAYNGLSTGGLFDFDYAEVDLSQFLGEDFVRVKFHYYEYGAGSGGGWWIDDVRVAVSRDDNITAGTSWDQWEYTNADSVSGLNSWVNKDDAQGFKGSLDNSLYTQPIDLTNALSASLAFNTKFNLNTAAGRPPDGFRLEISGDNGVTWRSLTLGVRSSWGLSGSGDDMDDNISDGKAYTGLYGNNDWVEANTLSRLTTDLSGWVGSAVILRFRMVTASDDNQYFGNAHYDVNPATEFAGLWIDDVIIRGRTTGG